MPFFLKKIYNRSYLYKVCLPNNLVNMGDLTSDHEDIINDEQNFIVHESTPNQNAQESDEINNLNNNNENVNTNVHLCGKDLKISKSQLYILCLLCPYFFLTSSYYSLFAPFFPVEALKKGINQTQVGIIFGIFQLAFLLLAPIFGKYVS
jgi:hypothetical protein